MRVDVREEGVFIFRRHAGVKEEGGGGVRKKNAGGFLVWYFSVVLWSKKNIWLESPHKKQSIGGTFGLKINSKIKQT